MERKDTGMCTYLVVEMGGAISPACSFLVVEKARAVNRWTDWQAGIAWHGAALSGGFICLSSIYGGSVHTVAL